MCIESTLSGFYSQEEGVLSIQGSVLSIILFSLKINDILNQLLCIVYGNLYAYDLSIFCQGKDMCYIERQLQLAINCIIAWANRNSFILSTDKTQCVHLCQVCGIHLDSGIFINQQQISISDTACFSKCYF